MRKLFLIIFVLLLSSSCFANVYQQIDNNGNVTYTDEGARQNTNDITSTTQSQSSNISSSRSTSTATPTSSAVNTEVTTSTMPVKPHTVFDIDSPKNGETLYNQPVISVDIKIEPKLYEGETIQVLLDGKPTSAPQSSTHFEITYLDRGTHQLSALLFNKNKIMIKQTGNITIYVHRTSIKNMITSPMQ